MRSGLFPERILKKVRIMFKKGLGEGSAFSELHPAVNLIFYIFTIGITMLSTAPEFLMATFVFGFIYSVLLGGVHQIRVNLMFMIPIVILMTLINTFFIHNGATVLFYLNSNRITLEALVFGFASSILLTSVIIWFASFNIVMTSDKLIYIFGKAAPVIGLTLSMIFRFIPLLKERYREIHQGQVCMGRQGGNMLQKFRRTCKEVSILVSWSLEAAIETSDSMEARGYGLKGRTSFHLFKMTERDIAVLVIVCFFGIVTSIACIMGYTDIYYYPEIRMGDETLFRWVSFFSYVLLLAVPFMTDIIGEKKWQR